ncbi:MAG: MFS transporter [Acidimicrobiales bacterium]
MLWGSAVLSRGAISAMFPVSVLAIKEILGSSTWAGLSTGASTIGSAISAAALAALMQRRGRNPGISLGFAVPVVGAVLAIVAIEIASLPLFLFAMVLVGVGSGTSNLARYAAADLAEPERRSRDISTVIFAATFGAVFFPLLIGVAGDIADGVGLRENSGGFAMAFALFALAAMAVRIFMRPDPLVVAGGVDPTASFRSKKAVPFREAVRIALATPLARLAFVTLVVSQAVMVMVMAMTPLHMEDHGHSKAAVGAVISAHTAGMFAFAPIAGWLSDRYGRLRVIGAAGFTLILATMLTSLAGEAPKLLMFPGLYLLGLGWSFGIVAGSALLTESVAESDRVAVQGAADTATNIASGTGALVSGVILSATGFHILSLVGMAAAAGLLGQALIETRLAASISGNQTPESDVSPV